jgi:hypothetical protein
MISHTLEILINLEILTNDSFRNGTIGYHAGKSENWVYRGDWL